MCVVSLDYLIMEELVLSSHCELLTDESHMVAYTFNTLDQHANSVGVGAFCYTELAISALAVAMCNDPSYLHIMGWLGKLGLCDMLNAKMVTIPITRVSTNLDRCRYARNFVCLIISDSPKTICEFVLIEYI